MKSPAAIDAPAPADELPYRPTEQADAAPAATLEHGYVLAGPFRRTAVRHRGAVFILELFDDLTLVSPAQASTFVATRSVLPFDQD